MRGSIVDGCPQVIVCWHEVEEDMVEVDEVCCTTVLSINRFNNIIDSRPTWDHKSFVSTAVLRFNRRCCGIKSHRFCGYNSQPCAIFSGHQRAIGWRLPRADWINEKQIISCVGRAIGVRCFSTEFVAFVFEEAPAHPSAELYLGQEKQKLIAADAPGRWDLPGFSSSGYLLDSVLWISFSLVDDCMPFFPPPWRQWWLNAPLALPVAAAAVHAKCNYNCHEIQQLCHLQLETGT